MDVADFNSVHAAKKYLDSILGETGLDFLINNAGIVGFLMRMSVPSMLISDRFASSTQAVQDTAFTLDPEEFINVIRTNVVGPALVTQICLPLLEKGSRKTVLNISSTAGSLQSVAHTVGTPASYSISKAALNMLTLKQKVDRPDFIAITLCPGWVKTDMGGKNARLEPEESIRSILKIVTSATTDDSGKYLRYNGEVIPW
ncbi:hypothetical protein BD414DRAFT_497390 [Trametes punicea]|nr:hypothetical protein BD414DRAFT_497390 [Trametes punicea]